MKLSTDSHPVPRLIMCSSSTFIYSLSNDASSLSHDYIASNERMMNGKDVEGSSCGLM
jgi:hypothetical protein